MFGASNVASLFRAIDAMDADRFVSFLAEDAVFRFGNGPEEKGREAIRETVAGFFGLISGLRHRLLGTWAHPDAVICRGEVTYRRKDGSEVTLPFADVLGIRGGEIGEYLIYMDVTPLFVPPAP
jgi:ketosteroid isomerase-like protein